MNANYFWTGVICVALVGWIGSRYVGPYATDPITAGPDAATAAAGPVAAGGTAAVAQPPRMRVQVRDSQAAPVVREIVLNGRSAPARSVEMRAEVTGRVIELPVERGATVATGDVIARLDRRDREAWLRQAEAALARAQVEFDAGQKLRKKDFMAETELAAKLASLEQAKAEVEKAQLDLAHGDVKAPFAGVLDRRPIELGDLVETGDRVGTILELDPLLVTADVAEVDVGNLHVGQAGVAELVTGERVPGKVRYIASEADAATRTFRVELELPNPGHKLPAGTSAVLRIALDPLPAHEVSSALLALNDQGTVGVKAVDDGGTVRFYPAMIVRSSPTSVSLAGLPERLRLITVGQGFVREGQKVDAVPELPASASAPASGTSS